LRKLLKLHIQGPIFHILLGSSNTLTESNGGFGLINGGFGLINDGFGLAPD
jgi:hypothetical protein